VYDFLLVITSKRGPVLHHFGAEGGLNDENRQLVPTLVSFNALARGDPYRISGSTISAIESFFGLSVGEEILILIRRPQFIIRTYIRTCSFYECILIAMFVQYYIFFSHGRKL